MLFILLTQLALLFGALARSPVHPSKETFFHGFINDTIPSLADWPNPKDIAYQHVTLSGWKTNGVSGVRFALPFPPFHFLPSPPGPYED